jgi:hypothetical protein
VAIKVANDWRYGSETLRSMTDKELHRSMSFLDRPNKVHIAFSKWVEPTIFGYFISYFK